MKGWRYQSGDHIINIWRGPEIKRCGDDLGVNLAISLHAVRDELRNELVPINRKYPLAELIEACRNYPRLSNARRITWEYVMLDGVNDSDEDCRALLKLIKGIPSKLNLIPLTRGRGASMCVHLKTGSMHLPSGQ